MASIAQELVDIIHAKPYKDIISALPEGTGISEWLFCKTRISRYYWLDTKRFINGSYMNPNALFELFGDFSGDDSMTVRKNMLRSMGITKPEKAVDSEILKKAWIPLHMKGVTAKEWAKSMLNSDTPGDEIALYALCKLYDCHCLVYTSANIWSTLATDTPMEESELSRLCDIHLMYIEPGCYGELKGHPFLPQPREGAVVIDKRKNRDGSNLISTLSALTDGSCSVNEQASTATGISQSLPNARLDTNALGPDVADMPIINSNEASTAPTSNIITETSMTTTTTATPTPLPGDHSAQAKPAEQNNVTGDNKSGVGDNMEYKTIPCSVHVLKLSALDCEKLLNPSTTIGGYKMWNRKIQEMRLARKAKQSVVYHWSQDELSEGDSNSSTMEAPSKNYRPAHRPSKSRMSAQRHGTKDEHEAAQGLLALQDASDADSTPAISVDDNDNSSSCSSNNDHDNTSSSEDSSDNLPLSKVKDKLNKQGDNDASEGSSKKGAFIENFHGLKKYKRKRNFACSDCDFSAASQGELNRHYLDNHGNLTCDKCGKTCQTFSAHLKHRYMHSDISRKYPCDDCDKAFPFSSQLKSHRKVHLITLEHHCLHCNKSFKSKGELVKHQNKHSGKKWSCNQCTYTTDDPRNLRAHKNKHGDKTRYKCELCSEGFNYYQQFKHHRKNGCKKQ